MQNHRTTGNQREQLWRQEEQVADAAGLIARLRGWAAAAPDWEPFHRAQALVDRFGPELDKVRVRLDSVLVVGLVGGTGVGKSTLINALVGEEICPAGSTQRPTTRQPTVVTRPEVDVSFLREAGIPLDLRTLNVPLLQHLMLIDCPDPDTQPTDENESDNRNRDLLRAIMPHCDVIVYVGSQQKYRSQAVEEELLRYAPGRRLVFVQSQAERDEDIRDDWRALLESRGIRVPEIFRFDAQRELDRRLSGDGVPRDAEFARFVHLLQHELANRARRRIKRANALDLCGWLLGRIGEMIDQRRATLVQLEKAIGQQQAALKERVRQQTTEYLRASRYLWRSKLLDEVQQAWGGGLFAAFLRLLAGAGAMARWALVARSRTATQLAVAGATAATLAIRDRWTAAREVQMLASSDVLGLSSTDITQARSIIEGYADEAGLGELTTAGASRNREQISQEELAKLAADVQARIAAAIEEETRGRVQRRARPVVHWLLELIFAIIPAYMLYQLGRNFFYDHPMLGRPLLSLEFIVQGLLWILVVGWLLRGTLLWLLSLGLRQRIAALVEQAIGPGLLTSVSSDISAAVERVHDHTRQLSSIQHHLATLQHQLGQLEDVPAGAVARA